jgi:hypothetical protein
MRTLPRVVVWACAVLTLSLAGCNCDPTGGTDSGADAGPPDAGATDAGLPDAGPPDAGRPDAGTPDAGPARDDAGCPFPTSLVLDAAQDGLPDAGLRLWLRGDVGLAVDLAGGVCRWEDLSGQRNHFLPGMLPPGFSPTGLRGRPGVSFSGSTHYLVRNGVLGIPATSGRTFASISLTQDTVHRFQQVVQGKVNSPGTYIAIDMNTYQTQGSREGVYASNRAYDADLATAAEVRTHLYSVSDYTPGVSLIGNLYYSVSGVQRTLTRTPAGSAGDVVEDFSGADSTAIGAADPSFAGAVLGDVLVYDRALTAPERAAVEAYFQRRYPAP